MSVPCDQIIAGYKVVLCDICERELEDETSAHESCEARYDILVEQNRCIKCGGEVKGKMTTHYECLGMPYLGYGNPNEETAVVLYKGVAPETQHASGRQTHAALLQDLPITG